MMKLVQMIAIIAVVALPLAGIAKDCPKCGSTLTDSGRCPYCQPKPKVLGQ